MHMRKTVKRKYTVSFKLSSNMSLKTTIWSFRVRPNLGSGNSALCSDPSLTQNALWSQMFKQGLLPTSYNNCSKNKLEYPSRFSNLDRLSQKDSVRQFWRFWWCHLTCAEVIPREEWFCSFSVYSITHPLSYLIVLLQVQHDQTKLPTTILAIWWNDSYVEELVCGM